MKNIKTWSSGVVIIIVVGFISALVSSLPVALSTYERYEKRMSCEDIENKSESWECKQLAKGKDTQLYQVAEPLLPGIVFGIALLFLFPILVRRRPTWDEILGIILICFLGYFAARMSGYVLSILVFGAFFISFPIAGAIGAAIVFLAVKKALSLPTRRIGFFIMWGALLALLSSFLFDWLLVTKRTDFGPDPIIAESFAAFMFLHLVWQTGMFLVIRFYTNKKDSFLLKEKSEAAVEAKVKVSYSDWAKDIADDGK